VLTPTEATSGRAPAASQRPVPAPRRTSHRRGSRLTRHQRGFKQFARPVFPSSVAARMERAALGLEPRASHPADQEPTTHAEVGTGHRARTWNYTLNVTSVDLQSGSSLNACDLVSHVALGIVRPAPKLASRFVWRCDRPALILADASSVAKAIMRKVAARRRKGSSGVRSAMPACVRRKTRVPTCHAPVFYAEHERPSGHGVPEGALTPRGNRAHDLTGLLAHPGSSDPPDASAHRLDRD
jgi:hypothetical protein